MSPSTPKPAARPSSTYRNSGACHNLHMEGMAVLESVAKVYAGLKTLSVEIANFSESGDEGHSRRDGWRRKAWFEAPNRLREETPGLNGSVLVNDGVDLHLFWA